MFFRTSELKVQRHFGDLFLVLYSTLLFSLLFALFVTVSCFGVFYVKIGVSSRRFLIDLTQKQLENDGTSPDSRAY